MHSFITHPVHTSRDEILLDGAHSDGDEDIDNEVFSLQGVSESDDDDGQHPEDGGETEETQSQGRSAKKDAPKSKAVRKVKVTGHAPTEEPSDSEDETWGRKKSAYYSSNAAEIASDDEEANELEEQEVKRLQRKARAPLLDSDFGLDDPIQVEAEEGLPE